MRLAVRALLATAAVSLFAPSLASAQGFSFGVAAGEVTSHSAILWARADHPGLDVVSVATDSGFNHVAQRHLAFASPLNDLTVQRRA